VASIRASTSPGYRGHSILVDNNIALCDIADMSQIGFTTTATRQWLKLSPQIRDRIGKKLETFAATGQGDVKKLKGQPGARLRAGDWRVIFYEEAGVITVVAVGHRRDIYD
jgi:mRNA interferase RelE/StbE